MQIRHRPGDNKIGEIDEELKRVLAEDNAVGKAVSASATTKE